MKVAVFHQMRQNFSPLEGDVVTSPNQRRKEHCELHAKQTAQLTKSSCPNHLIKYFEDYISTRGGHAPFKGALWASLSQVLLPAVPLYFTH